MYSSKLLRFWIQSFINKRTPLVLQYEVAECGAASLSMILRRYDLFLPLSELRIACGVSRDGSNLLNIKKAAERYGMSCAGVKATPDELLSQTKLVPCICWWDYNHFVVFDGVASGKASILDPAKGKYKLSPADFAKHFSGIALSLSTTSNFVPKGKPERALQGFLVHLLDYKLTLSVIVALAVFAAPLSLLSAGLSGTFLSEFIQNSRYAYGIPIVWLTILVAILQIAESLLNTNLYRRLNVSFSKLLTLDIGRKLFTVDFDFYSTRFIGDIASRLSLGSQVSSELFHVFAPKFANLAGSLLISPFILVISWQLSTLTVSYLLVTTGLSVYTTLSTNDALRSIEIEMGKLSGLTVRLLRDIRLIKACNLDNRYISEVLDLNAPVLIKTQSIELKVRTLGLITSFLSAAYEYTSIALAALLVILGEINLAGFMAFQALRGFLTTPITELASMFEEIQKANASLGRLTDLFDVNDDPKIRSLDRIANQSRFLDKKKSEEVSPGIESIREGPIDLRITDLSYRFSPLQPNVLTDINLSIEPGSMTTIVGPSGSGKSTLLKVVAGLSGKYQGEINFNGRPWIDYRDDLIRRSLGYVAQETTGIRTSILENIRLFDPEVPISVVEQAAKVACFADVIEEFPLRYNTVLKESGMALSGGQMQRLAITRSLCTTPRLLILDEATSALDVPTEIQILNNLRDLGITVLCVAHRLISAEMSDQVIVLKSGHIIEKGSPEKLRNTSNSVYSSLLSNELSADTGGLS